MYLVESCIRSANQASRNRRHSFLPQRLQAVEQRVAAGDIEGLLEGGEAVPEELAQRILRADMTRLASGQHESAEPRTSAAGSEQTSEPSSGVQRNSSSAAAQSAAAGTASGNGSGAPRTSSAAVTVSVAASAPAQQRGSGAERPAAGGDTDLDVFVAKLTLEALAQQREAAARSLEAGVWPLGGNDGGGAAADPDEPALLDWQSELKLIQRTGETSERRRARLAAERAAAAYAASATHEVAADARRSGNVVDHSVHSLPRPPEDLSFLRTSKTTSTAEVVASVAADSSDGLRTQAGAQELDVIDLIAAGGGYEGSSAAANDAWLDDEADNGAGLEDVTPQSSAAEEAEVLTDRGGATFGATPADSERSRADDEPWAGISEGRRAAIPVPWQRPGHERVIGQTVGASPWQPTGGDPGWRAMAARLEAELEQRSSAAVGQQPAAAGEPPPPRSGSRGCRAYSVL